MRILFVSPVVPSGWRGRRPYNFLRHLREAGHEVRLLCLPYQGGGEAELAPLVELGISARLLGFSRPAALGRVVAALPTRTSLRVAYCASRALQSALADELARARYDVLHCDRFRLSAALPEHPTPPVVWDLPDALDLYYRRILSRGGSLAQRMIARLEAPRIARRHAELLPRMAATLVCSPVDRDWIAGYAPGARLEVVENTVDVEEFRPPEGARAADQLLFAGTLSYLPNVDALNYFFAAVWPRLRARRPALTLRLVGTRPGKAARAWARLPGVQLVGHVPDMAAEMRRGILVCPIRVASGTRIKLLEAMAAGMPIVSSAMGTEGLAVGHERELLLADEPEDFARQVERLLAEPELRARLGAAGRRYALTHHSHSAVGARLVSIYESVALPPRVDFAPGRG